MVMPYEVLAVTVAGRKAGIDGRIEKGRLNGALLRQIERLVQCADQVGPLPRSGIRGGDNQQHRLRRLVVGTVVVEGDRRVALWLRE